MAKSVLAGLRQAALTIGDVSQRNYFTPTDHENASVANTHDDSDMSFKFTLSILSFVMPYIGIIIRCRQKIIENDIEPVVSVTKCRSRVTLNIPYITRS